jgi:hypothetical protein
MNLTERNVDLALQFVRDVCVRLAVPSLPEANSPDGCPLSEETDSDSPCSGNPSTNSPFSGGSYAPSQIPTLGTPPCPPHPSRPTIIPVSEASHAFDGGPYEDMKCHET